MGIIEVDLFTEDVDSPKHPVAESFKELLEEVAASYNCRLSSFNVDRGTVMFSFDDNELMVEILKVLKTPESI
jgi:hypothetical protein